jgi:hypothetical protein
MTYKNVKKTFHCCASTYFFLILEVKPDVHCFIYFINDTSFFACQVQEPPSMFGNFCVTAVMRETRNISFRRKLVSRFTTLP